LDGDANVGSVLDGRYRIESVVGRDGRGVTYRARHLLLDKAVAVTIMPSAGQAERQAAGGAGPGRQPGGGGQEGEGGALRDSGVTAGGDRYVVTDLPADKEPVWAAGIAAGVPAKPDAAGRGREKRGRPGTVILLTVLLLGAAASWYCTGGPGRLQTALILLDLKEMVLGHDNVSLLPDINRVARLYESGGNYSAAAAQVERALTVVRLTYPPGSMEEVDALEWLGDLYSKLADSSRALRSYGRAIDILYRCADPFMAGKQWDRAERFMLRAARIADESKQRRLIIWNQGNLARCYLNEGKYALAEASGLRAVNLGQSEIRLGSRANQMESIYDSTAGALEAQGKYRELARLLGQYLDLCRQESGPQAPRTGRSLYLVGRALGLQKRYSEAERRYEEAFAILERSGARNCPWASGFLADYCRLLSDAGRHGEVRLVEQRARKLGLPAPLAERG